jgi:hypothetical protein
VRQDEGLVLIKEEERAYCIISGYETYQYNVDWWTRRVVRVIGKGTLCAEYAHRGGHESQKRDRCAVVSEKRPKLAENALQGPRRVLNNNTRCDWLGSI